MIVVKVTYTVKEKYSDMNMDRIKAFLIDFQKLDKSQFLYSIFQTSNRNTFIHISQYENESIQQVLLNTPSFLLFQEQRDANLASKPEIEVLNFIGSSKKII